MRDGNRLLCPCCGQVLMVLKEKRFTPPKRHHAQGDPRRTWPSLERLIAEQEAHYENGAAQEVPEEEPTSANDHQDDPMYRADSLVVPIDEKVAAHEFPPLDPPPLDPPPFDPPKIERPAKPPAERAPQEGAAYQPPRDWNSRYEEHQRRRSQRPLEEATSYEMARLYAWAYYRLKRLAVQIEQEIAKKEAEVNRLQTKLNGGQQEITHQPSTETPMNTKQDYEEKSITMPREGRPLRVDRTHAQADLVVAPGTLHENGHGTRRHAHADEGMAPGSGLIKRNAPAEVAEERGPP